MARASGRGAVSGVGGGTDQPALCATGSSAAAGFGANGAEAGSRHSFRPVAVRTCGARLGVVAALAARPHDPAGCVAAAAGLAHTSHVHAVADGARGIGDLAASLDPA